MKKKIRKPLKSMAIQSETFTSLIEFVKNHLVKIEFLCHYQKPYLRYLNSPRILRSVTQVAECLLNKTALKKNIITTDKTITTSSNQIHLQLNNE